MQRQVDHRSHAFLSGSFIFSEWLDATLSSTLIYCNQSKVVQNTAIRESTKWNESVDFKT